MRIFHRQVEVDLLVHVVEERERGVKMNTWTAASRQNRKIFALVRFNRRGGRMGNL